MPATASFPTLVTWGLAWSAKTANYTALVNDLVAGDVSGGSFTVTLPAAPVKGTRVGILLDKNNATQTNSLTVAPNSGATLGDSTGNVLLTRTGALLELIHDGVSNWRVLRSPRRQAPNLLINPGHRFAQRQAAATATTIATEKYAADRWRLSFESTNVQYTRIDTSGALESGIQSRFYGKYSRITNTGKFLLTQPIESHVAFPVLGRQMTFIVRLKASAAKTVRLGVMQLSAGGGGTVDTIPAFVPATWGVASTDPTLDAKYARITPDGAINGTVSGNGVNCSVTTTWQEFAVVVTLPADAKNVIPCLWTDAGFAAADWLAVAECDFYEGACLRTFEEPDVAADMLRCQRYFFKTMPLDSAPAYAPGAGNCKINNAHGSGSFGATTVFPVAMRTSPTVAIYDGGGTTNKVAYYASGWFNNGAITTTTAGNQTLYVQTNITSAVQANFDFTADADL